MNLSAVPISLAEANEFIARHHRHHKPVRFHLFSVGCMAKGRGLVGVAVVMRPVNQHRGTFGFMAEVSRLATDGTRNACSFLLARAAGAAFELGYMGIQTYIRQDESGASLRAAGWDRAELTKARSWDSPNRKRTDKTAVVPRWRYVKVRADVVRSALKAA